MEDVQSYVQTLGRSARAASRQLAELSGEKKTSALHRVASLIRENSSSLIEANQKDIQAAQSANLASNHTDPVKLNDNRTASMPTAVEQVAAQVDPVGQIIEGYVRPNGLRIEKMRVPLGVVLFIYESRPNVTSDAAALCLKSGNAIILRGGKEALHSNRAIANIVSQALQQMQIDPAAVQLIESSDRALLPPLLKLNEFIDIVIPRGGEGLIRTVVQESTIPVLKHFTGNCHIYVDSATQSMDQQVREICLNAKLSYPGGAVCNAVEHILFHKDPPPRLFAKVCEDLAAKGVEIRGDDRTRALYPKAKPANEQDWSTEYLALIVRIKIVDTLPAAIDHINQYGSHHTDAILTESMAAAEKFTKAVDSASVMVNAF